MPKTAGVIIIGNEILSGKVEDSNSAYLTKELRALGVDVRRIMVIPDEVDIIAQEVKEFSGNYDYVFTSGGIGPTHDDVTIEGISKALGVNTVRNDILERIVRTWCNGKEVESSLKMAEIPEGAEVLDNGELNFPPIVVRNIYIFPGIPEYLIKKFHSIRERFRAEPFMLRKIYINLEECSIVSALDRVDAEFEDVMIGSYPKLNQPDHKVVITLEHQDMERIEMAASRLKALLPDNAITKME